MENWSEQDGKTLRNGAKILELSLAEAKIIRSGERRKLSGSKF